jgi:hypothetical protein
MALAVGWSGQWEAGFGPAGTHAFRLRAGQQLTRFRLHPGETARTPTVLLVFWRGTEALRGNQLLRQLQLTHYVPRHEGQCVFPPICASVNNTEPDGGYEAPHTRVMPVLAQRGFEVFWSDMDPQQVVAFQGINPRATYLVNFEDTAETLKVRGAELAGLKVRIPSAPGSAIVYYRRLGRP